MTAVPALVADRYRFGESLGSGGMGRVWRAHDEILDREVAIKEIVLPDEFAATDRDAAQDRMLREARAAARLSHPNVVQVYDVLQADDQTWIVMEYVPSRSLQEVIKTDGPLDPRRAAYIGSEILTALDAAHRAGVRHRDVKPANVLLAADGRVVLTDFGIASIDGDSVVTRSGLVTGSPAFMSPERARYGTAGVASDMWSLGATLYAAVEGRSPYQRSSIFETLTALASHEPDPPHRAGVLKPVLDGLLRKDPAERIDSAETRRRLQHAGTGPRVPDQRDPRSGGHLVPTSAADTVDEVAREPAEGAAPSVPAVPQNVEPQPHTDEQTANRTPDRDPEPAPRTTGQARRRARVAAAAFLALVVTTLIWLTVRPDAGRTAGGDPARTTAPTAEPVGPGPAASPATTGDASARASSPADPVAPGASGGTSGSQRADQAQRPELPTGWRNHRDATGFSVYVPDGWSRSQKGTIVYFRDRKTGRVLGIDQTDRPKSDPVADWRGQASYRVERGDFPGYREVHIIAVDYGLKAADWEYTFNGRVRQHVNNRGFVASKSKAYGIYWQTSDADWDAARSDLQLVFDSFRPAGR